MKFRYLLSWAATLGLVILWAIPVAFAGAVSNVDKLCNTYHWLAWVCNTSSTVQGIIQGVFPPVLLAVLFLLLPYFLRGLAWFENITRYSHLSISVYRRYYIFLVIHGFLIVTLTAGLTAAAGGIIAATTQAADIFNDPKRVVENLAKYLPDANIFFLTYMIQQGFTGAASALLQAGPLIVFFVKRLFFGETPRTAYTATFTMPNVDFGEMLPRMSLLATIAIAYSIIAWVLFLFTLSSIVLIVPSPAPSLMDSLSLLSCSSGWPGSSCVRDHLPSPVYVLTGSSSYLGHGSTGRSRNWWSLFPDSDFRPLYVPSESAQRLLRKVFSVTGVYIQHLCLIGLFFLAQDEQGNCISH
jgi:Calcium-dependent channel, 7TM region, putative phosphate